MIGLVIAGALCVAGRLVQLSSVTVLERFSYYLVSSNSAEPTIRAAMQAFMDWVFTARNLPNATGTD